MISRSFVVLLFALFIGLSTENKVKLRAKQGDCVHQYNALTIVEQTCTMMRTGLVRFNPARNSLQVCHNRHWAPYCVAKPNPSPIRTSLIGHWKMDEETGIYVDDDSGHENHGIIASGGPTPVRGKFSRGRYFSSSGLITIKNSPKINFDKSSFSVSGWVKILDVKYPLTTFAVKKGHGCYFSIKPSRPGWNPGWEIAHGYSANGIHVCIRDNGNNRVSKVIVHDNGFQPSQMIGKWTHYTYVFDRKAGKVRVYVNGKNKAMSWT